MNDILDYTLKSLLDRIQQLEARMKALEVRSSVPTLTELNTLVRSDHEA